MRVEYTVVTCDRSACEVQVTHHGPAGEVNQWLRERGWLVSKRGRHTCPEPVAPAWMVRLGPRPVEPTVVAPAMPAADADVWPEAHIIARMYARLSGSRRVPPHIQWRLRCKRCGTDMSGPSDDAMCGVCAPGRAVAQPVAPHYPGG